MRARLSWQIMLGIVGVGLGCMAVLGVLAWMSFDEMSQPTEMTAAVELLVEPLGEPGTPDFERGLRRIHDKLDADVSVYRDGALVGHAGEVVPDGPAGWGRQGRRGVARVHLPDGRRVAIGGRHPRGPPGHFPVVLAVLACSVALGGWLISRRITRRLEAAQVAMEMWGRGDLTARAPVQGSDEVADVARTFNQAADRIAALVESQRRVLASTSHELRSPLARIRMALELLDDADPERQRLLSEASRDVEELDQTVGELLEVGRMQAVGVARTEAIDLRALLDEIVGRAGGRVHGEPTVVDGDRRLLGRLVRNLADNASKHGGGEVSAWTTETGLVVADRGPGVPADDRLFEPFHRPEGHAEGRDGGVGLGLWLVREIATAHGASVRFEARQGGGALAVVDFG